MNINKLIINVVLRGFGLSCRFMLIFVAGLCLPGEKLSKYLYIQAMSVVYIYILGFELYQLVHRFYSASTSTEGKSGLLRLHFMLYKWVLLVASSVFVFFDISADIIVSFYLAYFSSAFLEMYRYAGLFDKLILGEFSYALRGAFSLICCLYIYIYGGNLIAIFSILLFGELFAFCYLLWRLELWKYLSLFAWSGDSVSLLRFSRNNITNLLIVVLSVVCLRLLSNLDKILSYKFDVGLITPSYLFTSALPLAFIGIIEPIVVNKFVYQLLGSKMTVICFLKYYRMYSGFCIVFLGMIGLFLNYFIIDDRFDLRVFYLISLSGILLFLGNAYNYVIYYYNKDFLNLRSNFLALLVFVFFYYMMHVMLLTSDIGLSICMLLSSLLHYIFRYINYIKT